MNLSVMLRATALTVALAALWPIGDARQLSETRAGTAIPFDSANVASEDGHRFVVSWSAPAISHVRVLASTDPERWTQARLVGQGAGTGQAAVTDLPAAPRWYFRLAPDHGEPLLIADRSLHLSTAANFRDAGGYRTTDGKWVRVGLVYRSNGIEHLTDEELAEVGRLHIKLVCDLRTAEEIRRGPDRAPPGVEDISADVLADDAEFIHSLMSGGARDGSTGGPLSHEQLEQRIYRDFVRLPSAQRAYRQLFERLADPAALPTVFHCTAGKDRTGWAQAVFLSLLGVPRATIVADYVLTNEYLRGAALASVRQASPSTPSKVVADPAALDAAFDEVTRDFGSFDHYLRKGLQLSDATLEALRRNFLAG
jgi:protein-tyrosine phosphatase